MTAAPPQVRSEVVSGDDLAVERAIELLHVPASARAARLTPAVAARVHAASRGTSPDVVVVLGTDDTAGTPATMLTLTGPHGEHGTATLTRRGDQLDLDVRVRGVPDPRQLFVWGLDERGQAEPLGFGVVSDHVLQGSRSGLLQAGDEPRIVGVLSPGSAGRSRPRRTT